MDPIGLPSAAAATAFTFMGGRCPSGAVEEGVMSSALAKTQPAAESAEIQPGELIDGR